jgi:hypothetical protein
MNTPSEMNAMSVWTLGGAVAFVVVFATAALSKIRSRTAFQEFAASLGQFGLRSARAKRLLAAGVIGAEVVATCALLIPRDIAGFVRFGPATGLLVAFSVAAAVAGAKSERFVCHCFGSRAPYRIGPHLVTNALLIAVGVAGMTTPAGPVLSGGLRVLVIGLGAVAGVLVVSVSAIAEALTPRKESHPLVRMEET